MKAYTTLISICFILVIFTINAQAQSDDLLAFNDTSNTSETTETTETTSVVSFASALQSVVQCPSCGHKSNQEMRTNACKYVHKCDACSTVSKPLQGDCCIHCSYGSVKCPSKQTEENERKMLEQSGGSISQ